MLNPTVRNTTYIGHGYWVNAEEFLRLGNKSGFLASPYAMAINQNTPDFENTDPEYFFGIKLASVTSGQGFILPSKWNLDDDEITDMKTSFKSLVPNRDNYECHDYVIVDREVIVY